MDLETLKHQVRFGAHSLQRKLNDIWGHVSARLPVENGRDGFMLFAAATDEIRAKILGGKGILPVVRYGCPNRFERSAAVERLERLEL